MDAPMEERDVVMSETETETVMPDTAAGDETVEETETVTPETETDDIDADDADDTETDDAELQDDADDADADAPAADGKKAARPYFAIYYSPALLSAVDDARGTMSANAYLGNLLYSHFKVEMPVRKTRSKYANKAEAKAAAKKARDIKNAALKMLSEKYAAEMAAALAALKAAE